MSRPFDADLDERAEGSPADDSFEDEYTDEDWDDDWDEDVDELCSHGVPAYGDCAICDEERDLNAEPDPDLEADAYREQDLLEREQAGLPVCVGCGCHAVTPCPGGCVWATADLCSRCVRPAA